MTDAPRDGKIAELLEAVRSSRKYESISADLIRAVGLRELAAQRSLKEAIKATKSKLHQVAGAYLDARPPYQAWLALLAEAATADDRRPTAGRPPPTDQPPTTDEHRGNSELKTQSSKLAQVCREIMRHHASTRERLPILERFYAMTLAAIGPARSVLDVACGLNPLALAWMPLADDAVYYACDIYADMVGFLNGFFELAGVRGQATQCDLLAGPPRVAVDLALVLKALPPLEQLDKQAGRNLLRSLDARNMLVSFPAHSLGGRGKGMLDHYERHFRALAVAEGWAIERFVFATELAFLVRKW